LERAAPLRPVARTNLFRSAEKFRVERRDESAQIELALQRDQDRVVTAVLRGPPGCGKSWLASSYAERASADYRVIWRLHADSETTLRADLLDLVSEMGGPTLGAQEERLVESALHLMNNAGANCLFIFDNADNCEVIERYLPVSGAARVLVLTTLDNVTRRGKRVEVEPWSKEAGADFLVARAGVAGERMEAERLSELLEGLPLALKLAGAYCAQTKMRFAEYRNRLEVLRREASRRGRENGAIALAYALSLDAANERHPAARRLMESAAPLGPGPLPLGFFYQSYLPLMPRATRSRSSSSIMRRLAAALARSAGPVRSQTVDDAACEPSAWRPLSKSELNEAIAALESFGLVNSFAAPGGDSSASAIEIQPLLRKVILATSNVTALNSLLLQATPRLLAKEAQSGDPFSRKARSLRRMAAALLDATAARGELPEEAISLLAELARSFRDAGAAPSVSIRLFEEAIALCEQRIADRAQLSSLLAETGALYADQVGHDANACAVAIFEKALAIDEAAAGVDHPALPLRLSDLALALRRLGGREPLVRARDLYARALEIEESRHGGNAPIVAIRLSNLAVALEEMGGPDNLDLCRALLERALRIEETALGAKHPYVAVRLSSLAWTLKRLGGAEALSLAAACLIRALRIEEAANGAEHPHVAIRLSNLAFVLKDIGGADNLDLAAMCLERALVIDARTIGEADPEHAKHLSNLAAILLLRGGKERLQRAEHYQREALRLDLQSLGKDHPQVALDLLALSETLRASGDAEAPRGSKPTMMVP
jgi:hypothetical protein